jgi:hypothetical protein
MSFSDPRRAPNLRDTSDLIPKTKTTARLSVPWTPDEQRAIRWLKSATVEKLNPAQSAVRSQSAPVIIKTLSAADLSDLVNRWKNQL